MRRTRHRIFIDTYSWGKKARDEIIFARTGKASDDDASYRNLDQHSKVGLHATNHIFRFDLYQVIKVALSHVFHRNTQRFYQPGSGICWLFWLGRIIHLDPFSSPISSQQAAAGMKAGLFPGLQQSSFPEEMCAGKRGMTT